MTDKGFYDYDLWVKLDTVIDLYEQSRDEYWNSTLSQEDLVSANTIYHQTERFASAILVGAETLVSLDQTEADLRDLERELERVTRFPGYFSACVKRIWQSDKTPKEKMELISDIAEERPPDPDDEASPLKLVWERLSINLSWEALERIKKGTRRALDVYLLTLRERPSQAVQQFLARLGRCYIWGFEPECVMLCRSVIDNAFIEAVDDAMCERHPRKNGRAGFTLADRIRVAFEETIIDSRTRDIADQIRLRGNHAVHNQPDVTKDVLGTMRDTLRVLQSLNTKT